MYNEQLDFGKDSKEGSNYFIYNINAPNLQNNYINDLQNAKIYTSICNEQKAANINYQSQLNYKSQPNEPIFPIEKPTPLFYNSNVDKRSFNNKVKKELKKRTGINNYGHHRPIQKRKKKKYTTGVVGKNNNNREFNGNTNTTGLFDPSLKKNELDTPSRTQKQRIERMKKILTYNEKFGKKTKNLEMYNNYLDALTEMENKRMEENFNNQKGKTPLWKYSKEHKEELLEKLIGMPKTKVNYKECNLDFNFSKYENMIRALQEQIEYERKMRVDANMKYLEKMKECENLTLKNLLLPTKKNQKLSKRAKSAIKLYSSHHKKTWKTNPTIKNKFKKAQKASRKAIREVHSRSRKTTEEKLREQNRLIAKSAEKIMDRDFNRIYQEIDIKKNKLINKNFVTTKNIKVFDSKTAVNEEPHPINTRKTINLNHFAQLSSSLSPSMENQLVNEILYQENQQNLSGLNKYELLSSINNSVQNYSRIFPMMINKVTDAIDKIGKVNLFDESTHPIIQLASKTTGKVIQNNIEEISNLLIEDLLIELVNDLQFIDDIKSKTQNKQRFIGFISRYFANLKNMRKMENEIENKLKYDNSNPYSIYSALSHDYISQKKNEVIQTLNPFDENIANINNKYNQTLIKFLNQRNEHSPCTISAPPNLIIQCEEYKQTYLDFMLLNGSFYYPDIFSIYDIAVKELCEQLMDEEISQIVQHIDEHTKTIYEHEVKGLI